LKIPFSTLNLPSNRRLILLPYEDAGRQKDLLIDSTDNLPHCSLLDRIKLSERIF
jgi:hypothetical protein